MIIDLPIKIESRAVIPVMELLYDKPWDPKLGKNIDAGWDRIMDFLNENKWEYLQKFKDGKSLIKLLKEVTIFYEKILSDHILTETKKEISSNLETFSEVIGYPADVLDNETPLSTILKASSFLLSSLSLLSSQLILQVGILPDKFISLSRYLIETLYQEVIPNIKIMEETMKEIENELGKNSFISFFKGYLDLKTMMSNMQKALFDFKYYTARNAYSEIYKNRINDGK
ncbi:hypothetical protein [Mycoplasma sp. 480]|uniref:hypothetical protein n=1 Tax=Mycoplasma sp. 480 TaxID=3440155 RepID=UPI003F513196